VTHSKSENPEPEEKNPLETTSNIFLEIIVEAMPIPPKGVGCFEWNDLQDFLCLRRLDRSRNHFCCRQMLKIWIRLN
jgi:hypothetical protein